MTTYVFDFYNLYIPDDHEYTNADLGIRIESLVQAEAFEEGRPDGGSKYTSGDWTTAKCYIDAADEDMALRRADWLAFLYSFAQRRRAYWDSYYPYSEGYAGETERDVLIPRIKNDKLPIIQGITGFGLSRIDPFIDASLNRLDAADEDMRSDILSTVNLFLNSAARGLFSAKFLFAWIGIERTSEWNYEEWVNLPGNELVTDDERAVIKDGITDVLQDKLNKHRQAF